MAALFVGCAALYVLAVLVVWGDLPAWVPLSVDTVAGADRWVTPGELVLLALGVGVLLPGAAAALAALLLRAPAGRVSPRRRRLADDLLHAGAVTLVSLTAGFVLVHGPLGTAASALGDPTPVAQQAVLAATGDRRAPWAVVVLTGYLTYLVGWAAWRVARHHRRAPSAQHV